MNQSLNKCKKYTYYIVCESTENNKFVHLLYFLFTSIFKKIIVENLVLWLWALVVLHSMTLFQTNYKMLG